MRIILAIAYLLAITAANLIVNHFGITVTPYVAFGLVGAALIFRDAFADVVGVRRVVIQGALIAAGGLITYLLNQQAAAIAIASVTGFTVSEIAEGVSYYLMGNKAWLQRAQRSAAIGAVLDSVLFITLAFGFTPSIIFIQIVAKGFGAWVWSNAFLFRYSRS